MSKILVVKTKILFPDNIWEGFQEQSSGEILKLIDKHKEYIERPHVEDDESYQQIIPQIILKVGKKIFLHKIPKTGSEGRLHDMWPIFLGGHVDDTDLGIWEAAEREFEEELNYKGNVVKKEFLGIVKMHDTPVNRVHLGLVWLFGGDCEDFEFTGDHGISEGKFVSIRELNSYRDRMTYWSQTCVPYFLKKFVIED